MKLQKQAAGHLNLYTQSPFPWQLVYQPASMDSRNLLHAFRSPPPPRASTALAQSPARGATVIFGSVNLTVPMGGSVCFCAVFDYFLARKCTFLPKNHSHCVSCSAKCLFSYQRTF